MIRVVHYMIKWAVHEKAVEQEVVKALRASNGWDDDQLQQSIINVENRLGAGREAQILL